MPSSIVEVKREEEQMSPMDGPSFVSPNTSIEQNIEEAKVLEPEKLFSNLDVNNGLSSRGPRPSRAPAELQNPHLV